MKILGVDPGIGGALAVIDTANPGGVQVVDMPIVSVRGRRQIAEDLLAEVIRQLDPQVALIEQVHAMPRQGVSSMFNFGTAFGLVRGVLAGLEVPRHYIAPQEWKRRFKLGSDKQEARLAATRLFPACAALFARKKDDGRAEAALLALYGTQAAHVKLDRSDETVQWLS